MAFGNAAFKKLSKYKHPLPIVINANWMNAIGTIRSLNIANIPSISLSKDRFGIGLYSNQTIGLHCPDYEKHPALFLEFMLELGENLQQPGIIMPTDDMLLEQLIEFDNALSRYYLRTYPEPVVLDFILDKFNQYKSAKASGVPVPYTMAPLNEADLDKWPEDLYPCIVKGRRGKYFLKQSGYQAFIAQTPCELLKIYRKAQSVPVIVQVYIPGGDSTLFGYTTYITDEHQALGEFFSQKTVQVPPGLGVMRQGMGNTTPELASQSLPWLQAVGYTGLAYIEYKYDARDGQYKLIELNARSWLNQLMGTLSGVNFQQIMYCDKTGQTLPDIKPQIDGIPWISRTEEIFYVLGDIKRGRFNLKQWLKSRPQGKDLIFGWGDPLPAWVVPLYLLESYLKSKVKIRKLFSKG